MSTATRTRLGVLTLLVSITIQVGMGQPPVNLKSLIVEEPGVYLLPSSSSQFEQVQATALEYVRRLTALHPYSAVLVNDTGKDIIAYSVSWNGRKADGKSIGIHVSECNFSAGVPTTRPALGSRSMEPLVPIGSNLTVAVPGPWDEAKRAALNTQLGFLNEFQSITITLNSVVFADGLALGQDPDGWIPRWKAKLDAIQDLADLVNSVPADKVRARMQEMLQPGNERAQAKGLDVSTIAETASTYEEAYMAARAKLARERLSFMDTLGAESQLAEFRAVVGKRLPVIHR